MNVVREILRTSPGACSGGLSWGCRSGLSRSRLWLHTLGRAWPSRRAFRPCRPVPPRAGRRIRRRSGRTASWRWPSPSRGSGWFWCSSGLWRGFRWRWRCPQGSRWGCWRSRAIL